LNIEWPTQVSEIAWSEDSRKLLVIATRLADDFCNLASVTTWELDIETGEFALISNMFFPTATP
jgi:hypothetical protein